MRQNALSAMLAVALCAAASISVSMPVQAKEISTIRFGVEAVNGAQRFQHIPALFGEVSGNVYYLPSSMSQTVGQQNSTPGSCGVFRERASHL